MPHVIKIHINTGLLLALALGFAFLFSCKSQKSAEAMNAEKPNKRMELLLQDAYFPSDTLITEVVKDAKSLQKFFSKVNMTRKPGLPVPKVDFSTNDVLIVCAGKTKSEGYPTLNVSAEDSKQIVVEIEQSTVNKSTENQVISYPFSVYKVSKTDKEIVFKRRQN